MRLMQLFFILLILGTIIFAQSTDNDTDLGGKSGDAHPLPTQAPATGGCNESYSDTVNVRVFDAEVRPVEGAVVTLTYQLDKTSGKGYVTTIPRKTGSEGNYSFIVQNLETIPANVDCTIRANVSVDGKEFSKTLVAWNHPQFIDFILDLYRVNVRVVD